MIKTKSKFLLTSIISLSTLATSSLVNMPDAKAFTWIVNASTASSPITGEFYIQDENANPIVMSSANIFVGGVLSFTENDFDNYTTVGNVPSADIQSITWLNLNTFASLTFDFDTPLNNTFLPFFPGNNPSFSTLGVGSSYDDGSGNPPVLVTGIVRRVPFEFSTTPGLILLGVISGAKYLYDQNKKKK